MPQRPDPANRTRRNPRASLVLIATCTAALACDAAILIGSDPEPLITEPTPTEQGDAATSATPVQPMSEGPDAGVPPVPTVPLAPAPIVNEPDGAVPAPPDADAGSTNDAGAPIDATGAEKGTLLWSSGVETGDTSDWDAANGYVFTESGTLEVVSDHSRTGSFAIRALLRASEGQAQLFYRTTELHTVLGAWYYLPDLVTTPYWALMKLRGGRADDDFAVDDTFDIVLVTDEDLYRVGVLDKEADELFMTDITVLSGQWFHIEADYRHEPEVGHLRLFVNGAEAYRTGPRSIGQAPRVEWGVGSTAIDANPPGPVFIDDLSVHDAADHDAF